MGSVIFDYFVRKAVSTYKVFPDEARHRSSSDILVCFSFGPFGEEVVITSRNRSCVGPDETKGATISIDHFMNGYCDDIVDSFCVGWCIMGACRWHLSHFDANCSLSPIIVGQK